MKKSIEIQLNKLIISFVLIFLLGVSFAIVNGYYVEESGDPLPIIVYIIAFISLILGGLIIFLFQWKISELKLKSILNILSTDEATVLKILIENNYKLEQNHLVALSGYNKVKISRILAKYEQKKLIQKKNIGNTNLIILKLK